MVQPPKDLEKFESFLEIVAALRGPDGCPWDKEQTHRTLTPYVIEEAHELAEAIEAGDEHETIAELGDVLLQVVLHAEIGRGDGRFDIKDVIRAISSKMVRRHPHVFSDVKVAGSGEVLSNWAEIKAAEKKAKNDATNKSSGAVNGNAPSPASAGTETRFDIPTQLPALSRAQKIGEKTKRLRFDWNNASEVLLKVDEELAEVRAEMPAVNQPADKTKLEHEIGDLLFSVAQLARHLGLEAEQCLRTANNRFEKRFFTMKKQIADSGRDYDRLTTDELEKAWQKVKASLRDSE